MEIEAKKIFDKEKMLKRLGNKEALCKKLIALTPKHFSEQVEKLKTSLKENDAESARLCAHTIKGMMSNAGAPRLYEIACEMQDAGGEGDLDNVRSLLGSLEQQFDLFQSVLYECGWLET